MAAAGDVIATDADRVETDLDNFLLTATHERSLTRVSGVDTESAILAQALRGALRYPVADALAAKVGQAAVRVGPGPNPSATGGHGGGMRPSLAWWAFRNYRGFGEVDPADPEFALIRRVAVATRVLLKAAVVIDDIQDGSAMRYGEPALHVTYGMPLALNSGCWLMMAAIRHVAEPSVERYLTNVVCDGFVGQAIDLAAQAPLIKHRLMTGSRHAGVAFWESLAALKTSTLFHLPVGAAAIGLRVAESERRELAESMRMLGLASQLLNDLIDFMPEFGGPNTHQDFDGLKNRVCIDLLTSDGGHDLSGASEAEALKRFALGHPRLAETMVRLATEAVELKRAAKALISELCRSTESAAYFDLTVERKGYLIDRVCGALRSGEAVVGAGHKSGDAGRT